MSDGSISKSSELRPGRLPPDGSSVVTSAVLESPVVLSIDEKTVISKRPLAPPVPRPFPVKPAEVGNSLVGETLGHFHLEEFVGGGGMGAVFRAVDTTLGRTVAVKVVSNQNADEDMLRRFRNEAQSAARLDHPNIARVYYVGEEHGWSYIVFEFIEGVNIRDLVHAQGPLATADAVSFTLQIAEALEHAAERDVVHRDIKPSNILVMPDGRAKLVDMGLARLHQVDSPSQDLTETGVTLGTFDYISPEQARDPRSADVRSDLYSLGCTLHFMLTGAPPFPEGTVLQKLLSHSSDPPPDPRDLRAELDEELCEIALRLMSKLPNQRFQSPGELIDRLLLLSDRLGLPHQRRIAIVTPLPAVWWQTMLRRHLPWLIPAVLFVAAVFGLENVLPEAAPVSRQALRPFPIQAETGHGQATRSNTESGLERSRPDADSSSSGVTDATMTDPEEQAVVAKAPQSGEVVETTSAIDTRPKTEGGSSNDEAASLTKLPVAAVSDSVKPTGKLAQSEITPPPSQQATSARPGGEISGSLAAPALVLPSQGRTGMDVPAIADVNSLIVATNLPPSQTQNVHVAGSVDAAFQKLSAAPRVETIELRFRQRNEGPLTLAPRSAEKELTIRAGPDYSPLIIFRPASTDFPDRICLKLIGGKVNFVGIHFLVELTSPSADEWSFIHLKDAGRVTFTNCSLTIRNDRGATATFFSIDAPAPARMMAPDQPDASTGPMIELKSCVVRGDANVVRATNGLPFKLNWTQGFLATSKTVVVAGGLRANDGAMLIRLKFSQITASLGGGLCLVDIDHTAPVVPDLRVETSNCVWLQWDPEAPLVEHRGIENVEQLTQNLYRYTGEQNFYPATRIRWRVQARSGEVVNHRWRDASPGMWYTEGSVERGVRWRRALPSEGRVTSSYSFRDFLLEPELANMAGFSESFLPEPREPEPEIPAPPRQPMPPPRIDPPL